MNKTLTGAQAKQLDGYTIQNIGIPSLVLMERAALAVAETVQECLPQRSAGILVACGIGNNGADGIAAARILKKRGYDPVVLVVGNTDHATEEWLQQKQIAEKHKVKMMDFQTVPAVDWNARSWDMILDSIFGIGLSREVGGDYRLVMELLASHKEAQIMAVDIASGIHSDTGAVMGIALKADLTVTFGYPKTGMMLYPGREYSGEIRIAEIGFAPLQGLPYDAQILEISDLDHIPKRKCDGNKGTFGKLLLIAGSEGMSGAAYLSALAAYRSGAGLVRILTVESNRIVLQSLLPEAIVTTYDPARIEAFMEKEDHDAVQDREDYLQEERRLESEERFQEFIQKQCDWADAIVMGPGLGQQSYVRILVETVLEHAYVPTIVDADACNTIAKHSYLNRYLTENLIITPHMGEMARLTGLTVAELKANPLQAAREYSALTGVICVMKDAVTVVADKENNTFINTSGCAAMAKGGSGDVLTGVIGALVCQGMDNLEAAAYGVYLHGLAGERAAKQKGDYAVLARDIADHIRMTGEM